MKAVKLIFILLLVTSINAHAQKSNVPENVKKAFAQKFPTAKAVKWDKESDTEWEAEFKLNGEKYSANFTSDGTLKETEHEIEKSMIPMMVKQTLDKEFASYQIENAVLSETPEGQFYEFDLKKGKDEMEVVISPDGKVVKKDVKTDKDNKEKKNKD
jgi:hypothetical protein